MARRGGERGEFFTRGLVQASAEVGAQQVGAALGDGGGERKHGVAGGPQGVGDRSGVEGREHGVSGAGVRQAKVEQGRGRLAAAGATERDARGGETPQVRPGVGGDGRGGGDGR